eukprot:GFYU01039633.1.p1 GENE.GFYU01039633.1~~GFYU01039633.1.p1  ORF type:complete len:160 (-),score=27.70 GFYU01039633.1:51-530(-)
MFTDMCVPNKGVEECTTLIDMLISHGYTGCVLDNVVSGKINLQELTIPKTLKLSTKANSSKSGVDSMLKSSSVLRLKSDGVGFRQYLRTTFVLEEQKQLHSLQTPTHPYLQAMDVLAAKPMNDKLFHACCMNVDIDVITINCAERCVTNDICITALFAT